MFRLAGPVPPAEGGALVRSLAGGFEDCIEPETHPPAVTTAGDGWPELDRLVVDLTGCRLRTDRSAFGATADGATVPGPVVGDLSVRGRPVTIGGTAVTLDIAARGAAFRFSEDADPVVMVLDRCVGGEVYLHIDRDELENRVADGLEKKAGAQGAKILAVDLDLVPSEGNRVDVELAVTLRMMFKAKVRARGRLRLDDDLTLVVEEATIRGDGMNGKMVASIVKPQLVQMAGKEFALGSLLPRGLALSEVRLETEGGLGVRAKLVSAPAD